MSNKTTLRSLCVTRIAPIAAALAFTLGATTSHALNNPDGGRALVEAKVALTKPGSTILKAKAVDLIAAVGLAIEQQLEGTPQANVDVVDILSGVLIQAGNKVRGDRDTIAGLLVALGDSVGGLTADQVAQVVKNVYTVNSAQAAKLQLTAKGRANAIAAGVVAAGSVADAKLIGTAVADVDVNVAAALAAALKKSNNSAAVSDNLAAFYGNAYLAKGLTSTTAVTTAKTLAEKVASANPELAGAIYGGLASGYADFVDDSADGISFVTGIKTEKKLAKALGTIVGNALSKLDAAEIDAVAQGAGVFGKTTKTLAADSLIAEGLLRANDSLPVLTVSTIIDGVVGATTAAKKATLAGVVSNGANGDTLLRAIDKISTGLASAKDIGAIGAAAINSAGAANPESATFIVRALADNGVGAQALGEAIVPKVKNYAAAGYMAKELATSQATVGGKATLAANVMLKGKKAANDIANRVAELVSNDDADDLADGMADTQKSIAQSAAVGVSIAKPAFAGVITAKVINHGNGDTAILGKAAVISSAVALAASPEAASLIAKEVGALMSDKGTGANKPIKLSLVTALATGLVKSLQNKSGVDSTNRMDEIGEVGAALAKAIIDSGATATVGDKLIAAVGTALVKGLSKTVAFKSEYVTYKAGLVTEIGDLAGSMALALKTVLGDAGTARWTALIGPDGALTKAILKAAGKSGSPAHTAASTALNTVFTKSTTDPLVLGFEVDAFFDPETDSRDF